MVSRKTRYSASGFRYLAKYRTLARILARAEPASAARSPRVIRLGYRGWRPKPPRCVHRAALAALAIFGSRPANAQQAAPIETPYTDFRPEEGNGVRIASSWVLQPELAVQGIYDTNIYNIDTLQTADELVSIRPRLTLRSDFARHSLSLTGGADIRRYARTTGENSVAADLTATGLLELGDWINVKPQASIARGVEMRGTAGDQLLTDRPVIYTRRAARLSVWRTIDRLGVTLDGGFSRSDYQNATINGNTIDLSGRDSSYADGSIRFDLGVNSRVKVYTRASVIKLTYRHQFAAQRGSAGFALLGGMHLFVTNVADVEVAAGYLRQTFDDPALKPLGALDYHLAANWTPRATWLLTAAVDREVAPSPRNDVPAVFRTSYRLKARHSLSERWAVSANAGLVTEEYQGFPGKDKRLEGDLSMQYRLGTNVGIVAAVGYRHQDGGSSGRNYNGATVSLAVRVVG